MIQFTLITSLVPTEDVNILLEIRDVAFINPEDVETISRVSTHELGPDTTLPKVVRSAIRVKDRIHGYRILFATETADELASQWRRYSNRAAAPNYNLPDIDA